MRGWSGRIMLGLCSALLCAAASAASASAGTRPKPVLHLEAGGAALAPGAAVTASGASFTLTTANGIVSCSRDELSGLVSRNQDKKDLVALETGSFTGEEENGGCISTYPEPLNEAVVVPELMPWELRMSSKGAAEIKAQSTELKGGVLLRVKPLNPPAPPHGAVACLYSSAKLKAKFATNGEPVVLSFDEIKFHVAPDSGENCSRKGTPTVSMSLALSSEGEPITATVGP